MKPHRLSIPITVRLRVLNELGGLCAYCQYEPATEIDHIIPYSFSVFNDESNLAPACRRCNGIAYNLVFPDFTAKREFILEQRNTKKIQAAILKEFSFCIDCQASYNPRKKGATRFLCPPCAKKATSRWLLEERAERRRNRRSKRK